MAHNKYGSTEFAILQKQTNSILEKNNTYSDKNNNKEQYVYKSMVYESIFNCDTDLHVEESNPYLDEDSKDIFDRILDS